MNNELLEAFQNWAHAITAEIQNQLTLNSRKKSPASEHIMDAMKTLHDAIQNASAK